MADNLAGNKVIRADKCSSANRPLKVFCKTSGDQRAPSCLAKLDTRAGAKSRPPLFIHAAENTPFLNVLRGGVTRSPGPLEVKAAQVSGDIQHLADKIQPRRLQRLHGF